MAAKLTLTIKEDIIKKAKSYARHTDRSLSKLIENYLKTLTEDNKDNTRLSPKLRKIAGAVKIPDDFIGRADS